MNSYIYPTYQQIISIHDYILQISGGLSGIVKPEVLQGTIDFAQNDDYYPTFAEKISYIIHSIVMNHCFADGNKRTALIIASQFIYFNTNNKKVSSDFIKDFEDMVVWVADGSLSKSTLTEYIQCFLNNYEDSESVLLKIYKELQEHNLA